MHAWRVVLVSFLIHGGLAMWDDRQVSAGGPYDRPSGDPHQSRSTVIATDGMVATSHPLAAAVGLDLLKSGGNAVDAAIAANAMLGLVEPMSCGIGGDLFVIYWDAKTQKLYGLNASGRSPYAIDRSVFAEKQLDEIPDEGPLSWSVPGCVDGWFELHQRFGRKSFDRNPPRSDRLWSSMVSRSARSSPVTGRTRKNRWPSIPTRHRHFSWRVGAPDEGEIFRNPNLAPIV